MSWLENIDTTTGVAVFGVATTVGVQYMKLGRRDRGTVVDVDAQRFLALWRAHPESYTYDVACGTPATWPHDHKWKHAVHGFKPGRSNPVPLALVFVTPAFELVRAPLWPPHWGRGKVARDLNRLSAGFEDGVTRTIWLLTHGAASFPVLAKPGCAEDLHRLAGLPGRAPTMPEQFFEESSTRRLAWPDKSDEKR